MTWACFRIGSSHNYILQNRLYVSTHGDPGMAFSHISSAQKGSRETTITIAVGKTETKIAVISGASKSIFTHITNLILSLDVAVFQWITCNKCVMTTRVLTLLREYVTSLTTSVTTMLIFIGNISTLKAILHEWSFHMKFIKLAKGSFNKFHMK